MCWRLLINAWFELAEEALMFGNHGNDMSPQWWTGRAAIQTLAFWFLPGASTGWRCCREETAPLKRRSWRQRPTMPQPSWSITTPPTRPSRWDMKVRVNPTHSPPSLRQTFRDPFRGFLTQEGWKRMRGDWAVAFWQSMSLNLDQRHYRWGHCDLTVCVCSSVGQITNRNDTSSWTELCV